MQPTTDPHQPSRSVSVRREVEGLLGRTPSFQSLDAPTRQALTESMAKIAEFLADPDVAAGGALAGQLASPNLQQLAPGGTGGRQPAQPAQAPPVNPSGSAAPPPPSVSTTGRVGEVARATLNAIDFPSFVASLLQGTFQAIVNASIQQMEAYAELLKNVATTVDRFMDDNVSDGAARDHLADQYPGVLARDTSGGMPRLRVRSDQSNAELPTFFKGLGFGSIADLDDEAVDQVIVPATRRQMAEQRQQTLATMVLMGINRVVVDNGEINAKLVFHIDASETTQINFTQFETGAGSLSKAGKVPFGAQGIMVNTTTLNAQSAINVRADLTGEVKIKFRNETFPLERFADPLAIQLINGNARVPPPPPPPSPPAQSQTPAAPPMPVLPAPPAFPAPAAPQPAAPALPTPVSQGLAADGSDPWAPEN